MYKVWIAYLLWLIGGFGMFGLHRFYLRKIPTGVLWLLTGGVGFMGAIYDFLTLSTQVMKANLRDGHLVEASEPRQVIVKREKEPLERTVLRLAEKNLGRVSPLQVAAASDWTLDQAQAELDQMVRRGICELRVIKAGSVVYHFAEFDPLSDKEFEV